MKNWTFTGYGNAEGFVIPEQLCPEISGGVLKMRCPYKPDQAREPFSRERGMIYAETPLIIWSPAGLDIPMDEGADLAFEIRNLSPETDGLAIMEFNDGSQKQAHFSLNPYQTAWQPAHACFPPEKGLAADRFGFAPFILGRCGDVEVRAVSVRPCAPAVVRAARTGTLAERAPAVDLPVISSDSLKKAFATLDLCLYQDIPTAGVTEPFFAPGGRYGPLWWQLDNSLAAAGAKWADQVLCERIIAGLCQAQAQNPDGRIDLYGRSPIRGTSGDISSLPKFFRAAFDVASRSTDEGFILMAYEAMKTYLGWWLSPVKRDRESGLITGVFEETFPPDNWQPQRQAQVDLNCEVAEGALCVSRLAHRLGNEYDRREYEQVFQSLKEAVNSCLWDEERGAYFTYDVREKRRSGRLICSTFDTLRNGVAPPDRAERLVSLLTAPGVFGWGELPVTSVARNDAEFVIYEERNYLGQAWFGDIWSLRNESIIAGLCDAGYYSQAARLTWDTLCLANGNYCEFFSARDGKGYGVIDYAWTASQYIQLLIERIFGIRCDAHDRFIEIMPLVPDSLQGRKLRLENLALPGKGDGRLTLEVMANKSEASVSVEMTGTESYDDFYFMMPGAKEISGAASGARIEERAGKLCLKAGTGRKASATFRF